MEKILEECVSDEMTEVIKAERIPKRRLASTHPPAPAPAVIPVTVPPVYTSPDWWPAGVADPLHPGNRQSAQPVRVEPEEMRQRSSAAQSVHLTWHGQYKCAEEYLDRHGWTMDRVSTRAFQRAWLNNFDKFLRNCSIC